MLANMIRFSLALIAALPAFAEPEVIPLWADGAPGSETRRH